jgi:catechol 2,3-dioxygenase-like lactoylglutathione lyase family enzyme
MVRLHVGNKEPIFSVRALTINCTNVERSVNFYKTVLGASVVSTDNGIGWWYRLGSLEITLLPNAIEKSPAVFPTHAMPMLWLEVGDLDAAAEQFARHAVLIVEPSDGQSMMVADPDGLFIEVWQTVSAV